ncbi:MAG: peptidase M20, partial [Acidobacteriota bacterium]
MLWKRLILCAVSISWSAGAQPEDANRGLARAIFRELVEIDTTDSAGDNTAAARAMAKRFLDAGFAADDVRILTPQGRPNKGNLVVRLRGAAGGGLKPILLLGHLDVVEARREDWTTNPFE